MDGRVSVGPIKNESKPHPGILKRRKPNTPTIFFSAKKVHFAEATRPTAKDSIVAKHGSFYLCTSDIESLNEKGWLTDAVLDAFLHYHLKNKTNIMHVCTQAMTTIFNGEGCHLFNKIIYYNPLKEKAARMRQLLHNWRLFVASRKDLNSMNESYEIEAAKFQHRQTDGWNCGVYVLEFLSHHLNFGMSLPPPSAGRRLLKTILATQSGDMFDQLYLNQN
ncbi:hypothetical protein CAPTEDRAFT_221219 [Capitella teleta]|uniref:Ubiquitin-like protease family profile domain-containing protein n=1 Tax=Capitella teleta TaxID=283909 RepID=R7VER1_CAPTE|nr:hypothetical protein CAPTEDRAFT_221219 [Capitella teleta]|eukprot:ELU17072.1 hypothetical protein CAPTEDRAFT_221219 [Capitella teleta]